MALFAVWASDRDGALALRQQARPAHRIRLREPGEHRVRVVLAGPTLDEAGQTMNGTLLVVEAEHAEQVRAFLADDPYQRSGVYERVEIRPFQCGIGPWAPAAAPEAPVRSTAMSPPLQALYDEHRSIAAVLDALQQLLREVQRGRSVDARVFRQILYYLDVFPERFHHPKEDAILFAAVRARTHDGDDVIARLERQHAAGAAAIGLLEQALLRWEAGGALERDAFVQAAAAYVGQYREHMQIEEAELMPLARRVLEPQDWALAEAEFATYRDPLAGAHAQADPQELFRRILYLAPPPVGLGDPG